MYLRLREYVETVKVADSPKAQVRLAWKMWLRETSTFVLLTVKEELKPKCQLGGLREASVGSSGSLLKYSNFPPVVERDFRFQLSY